MSDKKDPVIASISTKQEEPKERPVTPTVPAVTSTLAKAAAEKGIYVVDVERSDGLLYVVTEAGDIEDANGYDARKLAYDARFSYGFDNAGIEAHGGPQYVGTDKQTRYRQTWKLTRSVI